MKPPTPPPTPPAPKRHGHAHAKGLAPCGRRCILRPDVDHVYCTCRDISCEFCHHELRFRWKEPRL
jgi:hypothetical protein